MALILLLVAFHPAGAGDAAPYRGRKLADVLQEFQDQGLDLIFSSAVVGEDLVVSVEPTRNTPRAVLDEILEPLGLKATDGPGDSILILRRPRPEEPPRPPFSTRISVTPGRHSVQRDEPTAVRSLDQIDVDRAPDFGGDISRLIQRLPGVAASDNSAASHVRGSLVEDASFVLDGLELYDPFHLSSFQRPFSLIDSQIVDRVEFLGGGYTADYGDRHGGFQEITTVTPEDEPRGEIELGTLNSRVAYGAPLSEHSSWLVSLRGWYPEAALDSIELGGGERLRPRFGDGYVKLSWSPSSRTHISAHGLFSGDRVNFKEHGEEQNESVDASSVSNQVWVRMLNSWSAAVSSETVLSAGRNYHFRDGVSTPDDVAAVVVSDEREFDFVGLTHDLGWQFSDSHLVKAGFYARQLQADYRYSNLDLIDPGLSSSVALDPEGVSVGLYGAYRTRVSQSLTTEVGLRWDMQEYTDDNQFSPRFNLLWSMGDRTDLKIAVGRFYQSQRIHELRVEDGETEFLPAEVSNQAEITFQHQFGHGLRMRVDAYHRGLFNLRPRHENLFRPIELFPETSGDRVTVAPEQARMSGIELLLSGDGGHSFAWWISYALSSAVDVIDGNDVPRSWDQTHALKFLLSHRWKHGWFVSISGTGHTGWPTTPVTGAIASLPDGSTGLEVVNGERNSARFPVYGRLDIKVRKSFELSGDRLSLTLDVINLTDRQNACCVDGFVVEPGGDGTINARPEYAYWLGFAPAFSVLWEF